jgi:hypothetical protein
MSNVDEDVPHSAFSYGFTITHTHTHTHTAAVITAEQSYKFAPSDAIRQLLHAQQMEVRNVC